MNKGEGTYICRMVWDGDTGEYYEDYNVTHWTPEDYLEFQQFMKSKAKKKLC